MAANPKTKAPEAQTVRARVLVDIESFGLKVGHIFEAEVSVIEGLFKSGEVDTHPDAVAYAESVGAQVVTQPTAAADAPSA